MRPKRIDVVACAAIDEEPKMPVALLNRGILLLKRGDTLGFEDLRAVAALKNRVGQRAREIIAALDADEPL